MSRVYLTFYPHDLTAPNTFIMLPDGSLRAVISEAESETRTVEFRVRHNKPYPGAIHIRPLDSELRTWLSESAQLHHDLARMELQLCQVPDFAAWKFKEL